MADPKVAISMMTRNRSGLLKQSIQSVLAQQGVELTLTIFDNASTDDTPQVVQSIADPRLRYVRQPVDIGILRNWNRAVQGASDAAPLACIFHDDDLMGPGYLAEAASQLSLHPSAGFSLVIPEFITPDGRATGLQDCSDLTPGLMSGLDFLQLVVDCRGIDIYPPTILFRSEALRAAGPIDSPHTRGTADMNLYYRIAAKHDIVFISRPLVQCREHQGSDTALINRKAGSIFWYGAIAERIDAVGYLLRSARAERPEYRQWLADRLLELHSHQSAAAHPLSGEMYHTFENRVGILNEQIERTIPHDQPAILVDNTELFGQFNGRTMLPFLENGGEYNGAPADSRQAISELDRMTKAGARWIIFSWPAFWWLDQYGEFIRQLEARHVCRLRSPHGIIYELKA